VIPQDVAYPAFVAALESLCRGWTQGPSGIVGPGGVRVTLSERHSFDNDGHVDVEVLVPSPHGDPATFIDCVSGFGSTPQARARFAAHLWSQTTGAACLEFAYSLRGDFADHYRGSDPASFTNWHTIAGAIIGFGDAESASVLQQWWLSHPVLPAVAHALANGLSDNVAPHGVKILFGGDGVAEVRVDGDCHDAASRAVGGLQWPRRDPAAFVRSYVILLHPEEA
jgi:hypothetical protein